MFYLILIIAGIFSGIFASVAGMASIVSYPVLMALGYSPVMANVLSTGSLVLSGLGSVTSSYNLIKKNIKITIGIVISALLGGALGSYLLISLPKDNFEHLVPYFVLLSAILLFFSGRLSNITNNIKKINGKRYLVILIASLLVGIYIGYFGSGAGLMLVSVLLLLIPASFVEINAIKNFTTMMTNLLSLIIYQANVSVEWSTIIVMGIGMFIGGYVGPKIMLYFPDRLLKLFVGICAVLLAIYLFFNN
ncbi:integral membrane protein [Weissella koreensis KACC 15510]|uniref:sulfite exporter TauE/SafE family protein n=1 Tax=Weissella koreensis TaxID=165096 RepID=UPI000217477D|nr:sulfite exporter TauE/SafE family protein [Weissella koreensis]AEJ23761.1 integral membrane protein [Weissella koreensis KACC 15510]